MIFYTQVKRYSLALSLVGVACIYLLGSSVQARSLPITGPVFNIGQDPTGKACSARRLYGDPLLKDARLDLAYDINCKRAGTVGRVYLLGSREANIALQEWRDAIAPRCVGPQPQEWSPEGLRPEVGLFCAGGTAVGSQPATVLLAASSDLGLFAGDSPPASAPVVERAMRILGGLESPPEDARARGPRSALLTNLESVLGDDLAGGGFGDFSSLRAAAFENNSMWLFGSAELQFADALRLHTQLWPDDFAGRADLQSERAINLANQRRFAEAERVLVEAAASADKSGQIFLQAKVAAYSALAALNANDMPRVAERASRAQTLLTAWRNTDERESLQADPNVARLPVSVRVSILEAQMLRAQAIAASKLQNAQTGRAGLAQAAQAASTVDPRAGSWLQSGLAQDQAALEIADGRPEEAERLLQEALAKYRRNARGTRIEANLLMDLARAVQASGRRDEALAIYGQAFQIYRDQTENRGVSPRRAMSYLQALADGSRGALDEDLAKSLFMAFETLASPAVAQTAAATAVRLLAGPRGGFIRAWQDSDRALRRALTRLSNLPADTPLEERRAAEVDVAEWRTRTAELEQQVSLAFPKFGLLTLQPVDLGTLQASLGGGERMLRLALGDNAGIALLIDQKSVRTFDISIGESRAAELVARIKDTVRNPDGEFDRSAARELFDGLFANAPADFLAKGAPQRLIIETSGALASLPFGILIEPRQVASGEAWFARRFALMAVPSMRAFVTAREAGRSQGSVEFVGFGDFLPLQSQQNADEIARAVISARRLPTLCEAPIKAALARLPALQGTAKELNAVRRVLGGDRATVRTRERFTDRAVLRSQAVRDARVLMFSTHGVFATDFPDAQDCLPDAALLASAVDPQSGLFLDSAKVLDLQLDADLVVLSACDTGNPQPVAPGESGLPSGGDALSGLARSFFYAGARSVMVSHWVLPDEDTVAVMRKFFERVKVGDAAPEALRAAQLAQIASGADDPLQWAALTVVGAPPAR